MIGYALLLLGQTALALLYLGLCGGWLLWLFRRHERPYWWLAAPLAGLASLAPVLAVGKLYFFLTVPQCGLLGTAIFVPLTVVALFRIQWTWKPSPIAVLAVV